MAEGAGARQKAPDPAPVRKPTVSIEVQAGKANPVALDPIIHVRVRLVSRSLVQTKARLASAVHLAKE